MNMTNLKARITEAQAKGIIDQATAQRAMQAIYSPTHYGNKMTPSYRDSILTHRFGI